MKTIYKYPLSIGLNELKIPYIKILSVINQNSIPTLYAIVDTKILDKKLQVIVAGTGWELEENVLKSNFLGSITDGIYVWHVFYK
jgi:hypothetical protein